MINMLVILMLFGFCGCARIDRQQHITMLTGVGETDMKVFSEKVSRIKTNMSRNEVIEILGQPTRVDKEIDIHIKDQDTIWTYDHPVIAAARFIVIFRNGGVELFSFAVKDISGVSHYLTLEEFGM